jgi:hypothetical protein
LNNETKDSLLLAKVGITQQKNNKAKIANLKQVKELGVIFKEDFKMEVKFILGF